MITRVHEQRVGADPVAPPGGFRAEQSAADSVPLELRTHSESLLSLFADPVALVADGEFVVAMNASWRRLAGCPASSAKMATLDECLPGFSRVEALVTPLRSGAQSVGAVALLGPSDPASSEEVHGRGYVARWTQVEASHLHRTLAMVALEQPSEVEHLTSVVSAQCASINKLLTRQAIIEEDERRRLGHAMHDGIAQELAHIRWEMARARQHEVSTTRLVRALDTVIANVRGVVFELSPPILEDLGLVPALHWLVEYLGDRYGAHINVADDVSEPRLSASVRTIVFRGVRELAINAAKHARDAEIVVFCVTDEHAVKVGVRDTGPGFLPTSLHPSHGGGHRFGLLSVEQQTRSVGGSFEIVSGAGNGTCVTITVPLESRKGAADE